MNDAKVQEKFTENQVKYIRYLARGKKDKFGNDFTEEEFAKNIGVNASTLWRWRRIDGFAKELFDEVMRINLVHLPALVQAQIVAGAKKGKGGDTQAFMALMRQFELLKTDKIDHTTNGKDIPAPILGGTTNG